MLSHSKHGNFIYGQQNLPVNNYKQHNSKSNLHPKNKDHRLCLKAFKVFANRITSQAAKQLILLSAKIALFLSHKNFLLHVSVIIIR